MRKSRFGAVSLAVLGLCGCGPAPAPNTPPVSTVTVKPADVVPVPTASVAAGPDLSPVAEPADLVAIGRWKSPIGTASNLASCAGVAPVLVEVNAHMLVNLVLKDVLHRPIDTRKVASLVALDAPIDLAAVLDPGERMRTPLVAVAIGLTSLDSAKMAMSPDGQEPAELATGVWGLKGKRGVSCGVAASAGATPARLVCADSEKSLVALAPYLARTAPSVDLGAQDVHLEGRFDVLKKRYPSLGPGYLRGFSGAVATEYGSTGDLPFDTVVKESAAALQDEAIKIWDDVQRVTMEARSEPRGACLRATAGLDLGRTSSFVAGTLTDRVTRSGPPPAIYWRQPKDSHAAMYGRGLDPARFSAVLPKARELLIAGLGAAKIGTAADRAKIGAVIDMPFGKDTNVVMSHGAIGVVLADVAAKNASSAKGPAALAGQIKVAEAMVQRFVGWTLIGADEGPAAMKKQLKTWVDAFKSASAQSFAKEMLGPNGSKSLPVVKTGGAPASLGAGAEQVEITIPNIEAPVDGEPGKKAPTMTLKIYILVMGDGDSSWMAIGSSKDDLVKRLLSVKQGADANGQLGARGGLDTLKNGKQMAGGFLSAALPADKVGSLFSGFAILDPSVMRPDDLKFGQTIVSLPNRGDTPVILTENVTSSGAGARVDLSMEMQQGTFEDAKALVIGGYGFFSRMGILP